MLWNIFDFRKLISDNISFSTSFGLDPRAYHTVWGCTIGFSVSIMSVWGVGQTTVQRAMAAKSLRDAKLYVPFDGIIYHCFIWQLLQKEKK